MRYQGFCGSSNPSQSLIANGERAVNWYLERIQSASAPTDAALYPTPGRRAVYTIPDANARASFATVDRGFRVMGGGFYEVFATAAPIKRGTVAQDNYPATISHNGQAGGQLLVTSGSNGYLYDLTANTLTQIGALDGIATQGAMVDSRFLAFNIATGIVRASAINNGSSWPGSVFFARSAQPDPWQAMTVINREIWLIGSSTGEVWVNVGTSPQPFALYPGSVFEYGIAAPFSICKARGALLWLGKSEQGAGCIVRAQGYNPKPISNYAVDTAIAAFARAARLDDCESMTYDQEGHLWGVFSFPQANGTWCVDMDTGEFHERGTWNPTLNRFDVWEPRAHMYAFNKHLVGDRTSGVISEMDVSFGSEADGRVIRRLRMGPPLWPTSSLQQIQVSRFSVKVEAGLGNAVAPGDNPEMMFRSSRDAKTWSAERSCGVGRLGEYSKRCFWTRLGSSDGLWVPEVTATSPIPWRLSGAEIEGTGFQQAKAA